MLVVLSVGCDGLSSGPRSVEAPIEISGRVNGGPAGSDGFNLFTDFCDCYAGDVTLIATRRPIERIACSGRYDLTRPHGPEEVLELTILGTGWSVEDRYTFPVVDPHLGLDKFATCKDG
jgi:hypothetical protein